MKKILKKITSLAAAAVVMSANAALPVSAATNVDGDVRGWFVTHSPGNNVPTSTVSVNSYPKGYWACMTYRYGDCPVNNVTISSDWTNTVKVYEVGKDKARFIGLNKWPDTETIRFTVKLNQEGGKEATNQGKIMIASKWDDFEM